jgi:hypothetical protein
LVVFDIGSIGSIPLRIPVMYKNLDHISISLPEQKDYEISYGLAFKLAGEKLSDLKDLEEQCRKSDSQCLIEDSSRKIILKYLNRTYQVTLPDIDISLPETNEKVELRDKILILHYLTLAKGTPLSHNLIAYQELKEGSTYFPSFTKRAVKPLIDYFGLAPERLLEVIGELGGYRVNYGDLAVTIPAFSRVPITLVLWKGDDEFPPNANILFDSTILDYLSPEDVNILCQTIAWQLAKKLQSG